MGSKAFKKLENPAWFKKELNIAFQKIGVQTLVWNAKINLGCLPKYLSEKLWVQKPFYKKRENSAWFKKWLIRVTNSTGAIRRVCPFLKVYIILQDNIATTYLIMCYLMG